MKCVICDKPWDPFQGHPKCDNVEITVTASEMNWANALIKQKQERIAELERRLDLGN